MSFSRSDEPRPLGVGVTYAIIIGMVVLAALADESGRRRARRVGYARRRRPERRPRTAPSARSASAGALARRPAAADERLEASEARARVIVPEYTVRYVVDPPPVTSRPWPSYARAALFVAVLGLAVALLVVSM